MIDPVWNNTVENDPQYKDILIDIYGPSPVVLSQVEDSFGIQVLARALKGAAMTMSPPD